jgi:hypothetical protein
MSKKTTINESIIARFTAIAGAVLATGTVDSQIIYTDVNPDIIVDTINGPHSLDFNNDAIIDATLSVIHAVSTSSSSSSSYTVEGNVAIVGLAPGAGVLQIPTATGSGTSTTMAAAALNNGDLINSAAVFGATASSSALAINALITGTSSSVPFSYPIVYGNFLGVTDKFLGVKFLIGTNTHYGWARLDVTAGADTIRLKDYAYNVETDSPILAGQTLGLDAISVENKVTIKSTLDNAIINVTPDLIGGRIVMFNIAGQEIKVVKITDINTEILFEGVETGIYTITAQFDGGMVNKKVYIK